MCGQLADSLALLTPLSLIFSSASGAGLVDFCYNSYQPACLPACLLSSKEAKELGWLNGWIIALSMVCKGRLLCLFPLKPRRRVAILETSSPLLFFQCDDDIFISIVAAGKRTFFSAFSAFWPWLLLPISPSAQTVSILLLHISPLKNWPIYFFLAFRFWGGSLRRA